MVTVVMMEMKMAKMVVEMVMTVMTMVKMVVIFIAFPSSAPMRRAIARRMFGKSVNILNKIQRR